MERIAFISGGTFIYWSSIVLTLAAATAICAFAAVYLWKGGSGTALCIGIPMATALSFVLGRLVHWYCRTDGYESLQAAITDYTWGGYALMGVVAACLLTAALLRLLKVSKNLPQMLDSMVIGGGAGIAVGRLASFFNSSDRGVIVPDTLDLPFAYPVTNAVSGVVENRLATFMIQSILAAAIVVILLGFMLWNKIRKKHIPDGDVALLFAGIYGGCQILCDSTRYDALYMRSNGFISLVQILGLVGMVLAIVMFSIRMVKMRKFRWYCFAIWGGILAALGGTGYMEYYVQRHGDQALFAYSVMGSCLLVTMVLMVLIRILAMTQPKPPKVKETVAVEAEPVPEVTETSAQVAETVEPAQEAVPAEEAAPQPTDESEPQTAEEPKEE